MTNIRHQHQCSQKKCQTKIQIWCVKSYHWRNRLPFLVWIRKYKIEYIVRDIVAGLTIGLMLIPQCLAYAELAGLDAYFGLYERASTLKFNVKITLKKKFSRKNPTYRPHF